MTRKNKDIVLHNNDVVISERFLLAFFAYRQQLCQNNPRSHGSVKTNK